MTLTDVTYGQLDKVLRSLGFSSRVVPGDPPARVYEHKATGARFMKPPSPDTDLVVDYHLVGARATAKHYGIADPTVFDAKLRKAAS